MTLKVTGYDTDVRFFATRYWQGGRRVFSLDLSLDQVAGLLPVPDPTNPTEGNRRVKESHAQAFGEYVRTKEEWCAPALVLRAPDIFEFEVRESIGGTEFGVMSFPRLAGSDLRILDGQHRILGIHLALKAIGAELEKARSGLAAAKRTDALPAVLQQYQDQIKELNEQRARFGRERSTLQIFVEDDQVAFKQMFFDIADNALGITSSVRARFDSRKVVNRSLEDVMKHSLLKHRVDFEQDRIGRGNRNLMGAKHVAEIVRTLAVGLEGRIGKRLEDELREDALVQTTNAFLDSLLSAFPPLADVADEDITPEDLRKSSLLGSTVMLRVLAGVYEQLVHQQKWDDEAVTEFFVKLEPYMPGPIRAGSIWLEHVGDDVFSEGAFAPRSRRQDLKVLRDAIYGWAINEPDWLENPQSALTV